MESGGRDPQTGLGYTYLRFKDKKSIQLMGMFESDGWGAKLALSDGLGPLGSTAYAAEDYTDKHPGAFGKKLGIFVESSTNSPINETTNYTSGLNLSLPSITTGTGVLVVGNTSSGTLESLSST